MKRLLYIVSVIFLAVGCEKIDPFVETDEGKNVLGFYLNGEKISYDRKGGWGSPYENLVYAIQINPDSLVVGAVLDNYYFDEITIKIAVADISTQEDIIDPDISLRYLYRKYPLAPDDNIDDGARMERSYTDFVSGMLSFRKWDQATGILSGNFDFECDAPLYDGSVIHLSITGGNFDVQIGNEDYE